MIRDNNIGGYPPGAANDPNAPYNEVEDLVPIPVDIEITYVKEERILVPRAYMNDINIINEARIEQVKLPGDYITSYNQINPKTHEDRWELLGGKIIVKSEYNLEKEWNM